MYLEIVRNIKDAKLDKQDVPTMDAAWTDLINVPGEISAGIAEMKSGQMVSPELKYNEILLVLEGEMEIKERQSDEAYVLKAGDALLIKKGSKVTNTVKKSVKYLYVTQPPHAEVAETYYIEDED